MAAQNMQVTNSNTPPFTPNNLVSNIFLGDGVEVISINFNGQPTALGYFTEGQQAVGIQRGIVMSTGRTETGNPLMGEFGCAENGTVFANNNLLGFTPGFDPDLSPLATDLLYDITSYVITFIPTSDTLRFQYCFASEEYPEFSCSAYNDIFGFFIQGPNYPTPTNIALIPGTNLPVSINNIHPDNTTPSQHCPPKNLQYFINNNNTSKQPTYDGLTTVFTAEAIVEPCQTYTIKLIIADVGDPNYDSGVFLEAKSFGTGAVQANLFTPSLDGTLTEGCAPGSLTFTLSGPAENDFPLDYQLLGTAENGIDYQTIPANLFIPAGAQELTIPIVVFQDNLNESGEFLAIDVRRNPCRRDTIRINIRENTIAPPDQLQDTSICLGAAAVSLNGTLPVPLPQPPSFTNDMDLSIVPVNNTVTSSVNVFGVLPATLKPGMIRSVCLNATHGWADDLDVYLISPGGQFLELMTDCGANGKNFTNTCFTPTASIPIGQATAVNAPFTGDWLPEGPWSDLWSGGNFPTNGTWQLQIKDDQNGFAGTLTDWTITFEPLYEINYQWSPVTGLSCSDCPITNAQPDISTTYQVVATDSYGCILQDSVDVTVFEALEAPVISCGSYTDSTLTFTWTAVNGAAGYEVSVNNGPWMNPSGSLEHQVNNLIPGTSVTISVQALSASATPCPALSASISCSNCDQPVVATNTTPVSCASSTNGSAILTPDGVNPPYLFNLATQSNNTGIFTNLSAGTYIATITDNSGCQALVPIAILAPQPLSVNITPTHITCFAGDNGAATAIVNGGVAPLTYHWNDPSNQNQPKASDLVIGTYTVTVSDANGCTATANTTINQPPDLTVFVTANSTKCFGDSSGLATVSASGGSGPYQYAWSNSQTGPVAPNLKAGSYLVTVTDAAGCAKTSFALIGSPTAITANPDSIPATCANLANGSASVSAQGGSGVLKYLWNDPAGQTTPTAGSLTPGIYTVTISDQNNCTLTKTISINAPPAIQLAVSSLPADCQGIATGSATAVASGGSGGFNYLWNDAGAQTTATADHLPAGTFTVTVTDTNGCTATASASVSEPGMLTVQLDALPVSCFGKSDGALKATPQGGNSPYIYFWNSGGTMSDIINQPEGTYTVTVIDAKGCSITATSSITAPADWNITHTQTDIPCFGDAKGSLQLTISGGTGMHLVDWMGPNGFNGTGVVLNNLVAGIYTATITDASGCTNTFSTTIAQPAEVLALNLPEIGDTLCFGAANGNAVSNASGGTAPYNYSWSISGQTAAAITGLSAGSYAATVTDANNCTATGSILISQKEQIQILTTATAVDCFGSPDGTAQVSQVSYGTNTADLSDFIFKWSTSPVQTGVQATGLFAGQTYTVTATDAQGCSASQTATIGTVPPVSVSIANRKEPNCFDGNDGWMIAAGLGGVEPYNYTWGTSVTNFVDSLAQQLSAGIYRVTVTDAKGCTGTVSATLGQPAPLSLKFNLNAAKCFGEMSGSALALPGGGTPGYQFLWSTGAQSPGIQDLAAGSYELTLTDQNACTFSQSIEIGQPDSLLGGSATAIDAGCFGAQNGSIRVSGSGGTPPYRYALNNGDWNGSSLQFKLFAGTYIPRIQDKNGCIAALSPVQITQNPALFLDLGTAITIDYGEIAQLQATVLHATGQVQYFWNPADSLWLSCLTCSGPFVNDLEFSHWFELQVVDSLGCTAENRVQIIVEKPRKVFVPTGFSPNGDGNNDRLLVHGQKTTKVLAFQVFDRWGELLFEGTDFFLNNPDAGWDGMFRGSPVDPGVYIWVLSVEYQDGVKDLYRGSTTLIR